MFVETGVRAREPFALETEFDASFFAAGTDVATFEQFAFFSPASLTGSSGQIGQKCVEIRIFRECGFVEHLFETSGVNMEIAQRLPEPFAVEADVAVGECETFSAMQAAGRDAFQDEFRSFHDRLFQRQFHLYIAPFVSGMIFRQFFEAEFPVKTDGRFEQRVAFQKYFSAA